MATASTAPSLTADELLAAVKQLPPRELRKFQQRWAAWSDQPNGTQQDLAADDSALLATIEENSRLAPAEQRRFNRLRRKGQAGKLADAEQQQLQDLWRQVEQMTATRLQALAELARRRGTDVRSLMRQLGLRENRRVF